MGKGNREGKERGKGGKENKRPQAQGRENSRFEGDLILLKIVNMRSKTFLHRHDF